MQRQFNKLLYLHVYTTTEKTLTCSVRVKNPISAMTDLDFNYNTSTCTSLALHKQVTE